MIEIFPRECTATPDAVRLGETTVIRFSARSSRPNGEDAVVRYDLGSNSDVVIVGGDTSLEVDRRVGHGNTDIDQPMVFRARDGGNPCGDLTVDINIRPANSANPDDGGLAQLRISCE